MRHSMTNLYETLNVKYTASEEEIEVAYARLSKFFDPSQGEVDSSMKLYFDDITLAYKTLSNKTSRLEYDEYIS